MNRRGVLKSIIGAASAAIGLSARATPASAQTKHIRVYVEMDVAPAREKEMLDTFHNTFVPEAVKHEGYVRVKMLKLRTVVQGTVSKTETYRFELEYENEELRQKWANSPGHQRVWPLVEKTITSIKTYPVTLYDEV